MPILDAYLTAAQANAAYLTLLQDGALLPTGAKADTGGRNRTASNQAGLTSGSIKMLAIALRAGDTIASATFVSGATAAVLPLNQWVGLFSSARVLLAISPDATTAAWGANTSKTFTFGTHYVVPTSGLYYLGLNVTATTVPSVLGWLGSLVLNSIAPKICGVADTGQTTPPTIPFTAAAITEEAIFPYGYVS